MSALSKIATQRRKNGHTTPSGLPALDDHTLAHRVTAVLLPDEDHARAQRLTVGLKEGLYGQLKKADRDWLIQTALRHGAMPKVTKKRRGKLPSVHGTALYSIAETKGTTAASSTLAAQVPSLGGTMPKPPSRRSA
jgi:hypothetical protein